MCELRWDLEGVTDVTVHDAESRVLSHLTQLDAISDLSFPFP